MPWLALLALVACRTPETSKTDPPSNTMSSSTPSPPSAPPAPTSRPPLRHLLTAHPETVARQLPPDNDARVRAYLGAHADTPEQIVAAISAHEIWTGMSADEAELSVGPATRREASDEPPGGFALFYAGEGWLLRFDDHGFLASLVER